MASGVKSGWKNKMDNIIRYQQHEVALFYFVKGARWMLENKLQLPHLLESEIEDELEKVKNARISTSDIILGFQNENNWSEDDYSLKALRTIHDKLRNALPKRPFNCEK